MRTRLPNAFKVSAEEIAEEIRRELGLSNLVALDPMMLLAHLEIQAIPLTRLGHFVKDADTQSAIAFLLSDHSLSAMTVFRGSTRVVVYNDAAPSGRQASDVSHEAAHSLLLHEPAPALDEFGCRSWNDQIEQEAEHLGGCLLIPGKGVRYHAKAGLTLEQLADKYGSSLEMARWRFNISGGARQRKR